MKNKLTNKNPKSSSADQAAMKQISNRFVRLEFSKDICVNDGIGNVFVVIYFNSIKPKENLCS